ncbi:beta-glucosidase [Amycolatopsis bartoniae]|uniref:Beta-glucosidase n=1 Tax=Amycolatopsis bartoniae TaxID=941986 RepID=A0A8H9MC71_9PSEU|nr:GH1 family beta-glucosidase [Amycolatopsis bartoniae]MBB2937850.1 beta-glucosidase [Amycolatopsis bartoniae]TVT01337.1 beta-glucosidase [Amycolatopsis bartoniae]GHF41198.1 beta-glucosidase [Amycolatopsis bartoniae]
MRAMPEGFRWGVATAAYQIEGSVSADGRGPSIWDTFSATPGAVRHGDTGAIACDHYRRWKQDFALLSELGVSAYRFSLAWPRILPEGTGQVNQSGLDHYRRLVDDLLARGIEPVVTLYHWDLPQALQDRGGWTNRATIDAFARYAEVVAEALGDRVPRWITLNEPWVSSFVGYGSGRHAPGIADGRSALLAAHHLLCAHGAAVPVLRETSGQVGVTVNLSPVRPVTPEDADAARRVDGCQNRWFLDPLLAGRYPEDMIEWYGFADAEPGDLESIAAPLDFLGVNYYTRTWVASGDRDVPHPVHPSLDAHQVLPEKLPRTLMGWTIEPDGLRELLVRLRTDYPGLPPVLITENGAAFDDYVDPEGGVDDEERIAFLAGHLSALADAIDAGVDVRGYFCWSLLDNFEWAEGYGRRFGLYHVDYATQHRLAKASARWYADVVKRNGLP